MATNVDPERTVALRGPDPDVHAEYPRSVSWSGKLSRSSATPTAEVLCH